MFNVAEKQKIAKAIEDVIREINHPEMDNDNIQFTLHVVGRKDWSWAMIHANSRKPDGPPNPWNEVSREVLEQQQKEIK